MNSLTILSLALVLAAEPSKASGPLRLATFNIHHAEGTDGRLDLDRVAKVVRGSDVVAFQEVDVRFGARSQHLDQAVELGKALEGEVAFGGNLIKGEGQYGVALVSKFPIRSSRNHPLPRSAGRENAEPRGLLEVTIEANGIPIRVFVTHLAHDSAADRDLQIDAVRRIVASARGPFILMGDLNLRPDSDSYRQLMAKVDVGAPKEAAPRFVDAWVKGGHGAGATIGLKGKHPGRIDYILLSPDLAEGLESITVDTETIASDHQPVFATLRLSAPPR